MSNCCCMLFVCCLEVKSEIFLLTVLFLCLWNKYTAHKNVFKVLANIHNMLEQSLKVPFPTICWICVQKISSNNVYINVRIAEPYSSRWHRRNLVNQAWYIFDKPICYCNRNQNSLTLSNIKLSSVRFRCSHKNPSFTTACENGLSMSGYGARCRVGRKNICHWLAAYGQWMEFHRW